MAFTAQAWSPLAAMVNLIPLRKGTVLDASRVSSMEVLSSDLITICLVMHHMGNELLSCLSASR